MRLTMGIAALLGVGLALGTTCVPAWGASGCDKQFDSTFALIRLDLRAPRLHQRVCHDAAAAGGLTCRPTCYDHLVDPPAQSVSTRPFPACAASFPARRSTACCG